MFRRAARTLAAVAAFTGCVLLTVPPAGSDVHARAQCYEPYAPIYAARTVESPIFGPQQVFPATPVASPLLLPPTDAPDARGVLEIAEGASTVLLDDGDGRSFVVPDEAQPVPAGPRLSIVEDEGHELLVLHRTEFVVGRPVLYLVVWDLGEPCRALPEVTTTTTPTAPSTSEPPVSTTAPSTTVLVDCLCAPPLPGPPAPTPATPVRASASYTG